MCVCVLFTDTEQARPCFITCMPKTGSILQIVGDVNKYHNRGMHIFIVKIDFI